MSTLTQPRRWNELNSCVYSNNAVRIKLILRNMSLDERNNHLEHLERGATLLQHACWAHKEKSVEALLDFMNRDQINQRSGFNTGKTALLFLISKQMGLNGENLPPNYEGRDLSGSRILPLLISRGADVRVSYVQGSNVWTALDKAQYLSRFPRMAQMILNQIAEEEAN